MNREEDYDDFDDDISEDWKDLETATPAPDTLRVRPRRDWRDIERFREDREMKKFLSTQDWFDDLDQPEKTR